MWRALTSIPPGETRTYAQLAEMIGNTRAVRAVARSCATNPVSLAVPCHRVVGSNGDLTGYRWGVPRKQALLAQEASLSGVPGGVPGGERKARQAGRKMEPRMNTDEHG